MSRSKQRVLIGSIVVQTIVILVLIFKIISLRNDALYAQTEAGYYKKAFEESEDVALEKLLDEREGLLRDYEAIQEISRSHGIQLRDSF